MRLSYDNLSRHLTPREQKVASRYSAWFRQQSLDNQLKIHTLQRSQKTNIKEFVAENSFATFEQVMQTIHDVPKVIEVRQPYLNPDLYLMQAKKIQSSQ